MSRRASNNPTGRARRLYLAGIVAVVAGLAAWVSSSIVDKTGGVVAAPLDDAYIHLQFARSYARLEPLAYIPGGDPVAGATSLLWPFLLMPLVWLGAEAPELVGATWLLGWLALAALAREVWLAAEPWLGRAATIGAALGVVMFAGHVWFAASGMVVLPLAWLLVRTARRSAEWLEGEHRNSGELYALAVMGPLLRPEGSLTTVLVAAAFFTTARGRQRLQALLPLAAVGLPPFIYWLSTGSSTSTTATAKWLPLHPFLELEQIAQRIGAQVADLFLVLLDGEQHAAAFLPQHFGPLAWLALPSLLLATQRKGFLARGILLSVVGLGILIPTSYETFLWNRLRYLWPFISIWILGCTAFFDLIGASLSEVHRAFRVVTPALAFGLTIALATKLPLIVHDVSVSAAGISQQQVALGKWAREHLPKDARIGVNDAGAIAYFSKRATFDIVGLTTAGEARYWLAGAGSRFEHYEHLPPNELPTHFIVYPRWMAIDPLLGQPLTYRSVPEATILGGVTMGAYLADYSLLGSGSRPRDAPPGKLIDELDISDLKSEERHRYDRRRASQYDNVVFVSPDLAMADGGRRRRQLDSFLLHARPGAVLVARLASEKPVQARVRVDGDEVATRWIIGPWQEIRVALPQVLEARDVRIDVYGDQFSALHYWSYAPTIRVR